MLKTNHPQKSHLIWDDLGLSNPYSGVGVYSRMLFKHLASHGWCPQSFRGKLNSEEDFLKANPSKLVLPQLRLFLAPMRSIVHGLSNINGPLLHLRSDIKSIVTIHDLIPLLTSMSSRYGRLFRAIIMRIANSSDAIVTVSHWTKEQLVERGISPEKIHVILNGFPEWRPQQRTQRNYLLCVSRYEDYKQVEFFIELAKRLNLKAVLVTDELGAEQIGKRYHELCEKGQLDILKSLTSQQLAKLYEQAMVYVHPSKFEGFCLPAAEANACGVPVIYKAGSGIDEVVKFGRGLGSYDLEEWKDAVIEFIDKPPENSLEDMVKSQSWARSAQKLAQVYDQLNEGLS